MERPLLTEYLLRLATNSEEHETFRSSTTAAHGAMITAGLTDEQRNAVLSGNPRLIQSLVSAELIGLMPSEGDWKARPGVIIQFQVLLAALPDPGSGDPSPGDPPDPDL